METMTTGRDAVLDGLAETRLKDLDRWLKRTTAWFNACDRYTAGGEAPSVRRMPSKASKYEAYSAAGSLIRMLDLNLDRPQTVADLQAVSKAAHEDLGK